MAEVAELVFICGTWAAVPGRVRFGVEILEQRIQTGKEMSNAGRYLVNMITCDTPRQEVKVFCNVEHVLNGIRAAIAELPDDKVEEVIKRIRIIFYDEDGNCSEDGEKPVRIMKSGSLNHWPKGMMDQQIQDLRIISQARSRNKIAQ